MERPRVVGVKEFVLQERTPPSQEEFDFVEKWEPHQAESKGVKEGREMKPALAPSPAPTLPSFFSRLKSMLGLR